MIAFRDEADLNKMNSKIYFNDDMFFCISSRYTKSQIVNVYEKTPKFKWNDVFQYSHLNQFSDSFFLSGDW